MFDRKRAFTLIELLVVVAIIALLISILLPSLQGAREQGKRAKCLANMKSISQASVAYASEDKREIITPISQMAASTANYQGWSGAFQRMDNGPYGPAEGSSRIAIPTSYGGRTAQKPFGNVRIMLDDMDPDGAGGSQNWVAKHRPLNRYVLGSNEQSDSKSVEVFHCPADTGYPDHHFIKDAPKVLADIPLYDVVGNSYRINVAGLFWAAGNMGFHGAFSVGAWGHKFSTLQDTGKLAMYTEPIFYNASRVFTEPGDPGIVGWHKALMTDNVAYCDGSARSTRAIQLVSWPDQLLRDMEYTDPDGGLRWDWFLRRGDTWKTDCYPTPGARIVVRNATTGTIVTPQIQPPAIPANAMTRWPFRSYQDNSRSE
jgi:prepilin-type N-terminal cleavage/methylation domain-containing protein